MTQHSQPGFPLSFPRLVAPQLSRYLVHNPNLSDWLEDCADVSLVLAVAPAGFGKTTAMLALHERLRESGMYTAWIQLGADDNHLERFCSLMLSALMADLPEGAIPAPAPPPNMMDAPYAGSGLGQLLLESISGLQHDCAIFLDDFDHLKDPRAIDLMQRLIERLPPSCKLFITARSTPPLRFYKWKAQGRLLQIGMAELCFDFEQADQFLNHRHQLDLDAASVRRLLNATEGWPAGLQLAALALKSRDDRPGFIANFCEQTADIGRYLYDEVFWDQRDEIKQFLLQTSIVKQLNPGICNAVTESQHAITLLRQLEQQSLFILRMGAAGNEYRYHPLFAEFLQRRLNEDHPEWLSALHGRAATWYLQIGEHASAIDHSLKAGHHEQACEILLNYVWQALARGHTSTCRHWLGAIPKPVLARYPELQVALAWACIFRHEYTQASEIARQLKSEPAVQGLHEYRVLEPLSLALMDRVAECEAALQRYDGVPLSGLSDAILECLRAYVDLVSQRFAQAIAKADAARSQLKRLGSIYGMTYALGIIGYALLAQGRAREAVAMLEPHYDELSKSLGRQSVSTACVGAFLAGALYELGEFTQAEALANEYLDQSTELLDLDASAILYRIVSRAHCRSAHFAEAARSLQAGIDMGRSLAMPRIVATLRLEQQYLAVQQFDHGLAVDMDRIALQPTGWTFAPDRLTPINDVEDPTVAQCRRQLREGKAGEVLRLCTDGLTLAQEHGRIRRVLKLHLLRALALQQLDQPGEALADMEAALRIEARFGLRASFWEEGAALTGLLRQCLEHGLETNPFPQVATLLVSAPDRLRPAELITKAAPAEWAQTSPAPLQGEEAPALEPGLAPGIAPGLSPRELQILQCLAAGMPNKQIASSLHISEPTVKFHLRNINHKLDARNRTHAVFIARERGWVQ